jgi:hypothetical protein
VGVFAQGAGLILLKPAADQLTRNIMSLGKRVQALPGNELLRDLPLERDAVGTLSGHGFYSLKAQLLKSLTSTCPASVVHSRATMIKNWPTHWATLF